MIEVEEEEIDTLHRQIYQLVVDDIPKAVVTYADVVRERRKLLKEISKVIEPLNVKKGKGSFLLGNRVAQFVLTVIRLEGFFALFALKHFHMKDCVIPLFGKSGNFSPASGTFGHIYSPVIL